MKGVGKSVFRGTEVAEFGVEILGVLKNQRPGRDLILIRASGCSLEKSGIVAGMSGSPVYIDGKLIGAVASAWTFSKEPIGGVTPIAAMLPLVEEQNRRPEAAERAEVPSETGEQPVAAKVDWDAFVREHARFRTSTSPAGPNLSRPQASTSLSLCRLPTPVVMSSCPEPLMGLLRSRFEPYGLVPVVGGAAAGKSAKPAKLAPGMPVGVQLLRGDWQLAATGTVTAMLGDSVLAFGHSIFGEGRVELPMATAYVHTILPSQLLSFKISSTLDTVGRFSVDRATGAAGMVGRHVSLIPLNVSVNRSDMGLRRKFRFEMIDHPNWSPMLAFVATARSVLADGDPPKEATLTYKAKVAIEGGDPLVLQNTSAGASSDGLMESAGDIGRTVAMLMDNPFAKVGVKGIEAEIEVRKGRQTAAIESVRVDRTEVAPGEVIRASVVLRPFMKDDVVQTIEVAVPKDAPLGLATLYVSDRSRDMLVERRAAPHRYRPTTLIQLMNLIRAPQDRTALVTRLALPRIGLAVQGVELPALPRSVLGIMGSAQQSGATPVFRTVPTFIPTDYVLQGSHRIRVLIKREAN